LHWVYFEGYILKYQSEEIVIFMLTGILVFFFLSMSFNVIFKGIVVDAEKSKLISHILSSILSIISLFIGYKLKDKKEKEKDK
jgi:ABC-type polysaccharide/polyol phosphate export permease